MEKIKILEYIDTFYPVVDGAISVVKNYVLELNKKATCKLATPAAKYSQHYKDVEEFEVLRCASSGAPENYRLGHPDIDAKFQKKIESENFDIMHTHSPFAMGRFALKEAKKLHIPLVATLHTQYHLDFDRVLNGNKPLVDFMIKYIMKVFNGADSVWTVSEASCKYLRQYGYKGDIEVVRNGTDFVYPDNPEELIEKVNNAHNLKGQKNVFLFVGRMAWYKNIKLIIDAVKIMKDKGVDFKMLFVGGGFDIEEITEYAEKNDLNDKIIFVGNVKDRNFLQGYYLRSDLMLFPSTFDMASISKEEAAAHKKATVVVKDSCSAEEVVDNENGFLCEESAESLAERVMEIISQEGLTVRAGENAYKTIYRTWDKVAEEVIEKYKKVIADYNLKMQEKKTKKVKSSEKTKTKKEKDIKTKKTKTQKEKTTKSKTKNTK